MRYCDVVAKGVITSVTVSWEPRLDAMPMISGGRDGTYVEMTKIELASVDLVRGETSQKVQSFFVLGTSRYEKNYRVGQEIIVGLVWGADVLGGNYWLWSDRGKLVRDGTRWTGQSPVAIEDLAEITRGLDGVALHQVAVSSDIAAIGTVADVVVATVHGAGGDAVEMSIRFSGVEALDGRVLPAEIVVKQIMSGNYWPEWRDAAPFREIPKTGTRYCIFIKRIDDGYALLHGVNGIFEIRGDQLFFAGRTQANLTTRQVRSLRRSE